MEITNLELALLNQGLILFNQRASQKISGEDACAMGLNTAIIDQPMRAYNSAISLVNLSSEEMNRLKEESDGGDKKAADKINSAIKKVDYINSQIIDIPLLKVKATTLYKIQEITSDMYYFLRPILDLTPETKNTHFEEVEVEEINKF